MVNVTIYSIHGSYGFEKHFHFFSLWSISPANLQSSQNWKGHLLKVEHGTGNPHDTKIGRILLTHSKWPCFVWVHVWFQRGKRSVYHITWLWYSFSCALYKVQLRSNCSQIVPQAEIWVVITNLTVVVMFKQVLRVCLHAYVWNMSIYGYWSKPWHLVNPKIAGKWMFIPLELIIIGFDQPPYVNINVNAWKNISIHFSMSVDMSVDSICTFQTAETSAFALNFPLMYCIPWRIHGAAIYGAPWIPSIYPLYVSIYIPAPWILWVYTYVGNKC